MALPIWLSQTSLAATILTSTAGTYIGFTPPNPGTKPVPSTGDLWRRLSVTNKRFINIAFAPLGLLALHASSLAYFYPHIPPLVLRGGAANGLNPDLVTWSGATSIPLALILCAGIPLRLVPYASLGKNFTFTLAEPDRLKTTGIYRYVQHPSYTGLLVLLVSNVALLGRTDGALSCWIPPAWHKALQALVWGAILSLSIFGVWTRVWQEERMLRARFGAEWENWHARTPRFVPWLF
ncbi:hypothetical protein F4820DRAFT_411132 [Hypoxylon rubiginosum]|uniref:Uncharacterized protein n=1 Tax=Hypoxylon rubiginosum TaxID=110542 RepID=A0ACB9ZA15_9PEZI|nr:hypothetical protein F4820DRAFT_411132 [Hypoxylon rubiginosum]